MVASGLRVLLLLGRDGPSANVRGTVYLPRLRARYQTDVRALYRPALTRLRERAAGPEHPLLRRLLTAPVDVAVVGLHAILERDVLRVAERYDRIILIKYFDAKFVRTLRSASRATILYDMDDAMWLPEFLGPLELEAVLRNVDAVSCDNEYLCSHARPFNPNAFVLRGPVKLLPRASRPERPAPIVAWIGSPSTLHYLDNVTSALAEAAERLPSGLVFRVVGGGYDRSRWPRPADKLAVEVIAQYDEAEMHRQLADIDVGLFPLNHDENSLGRGILKATLYMSAGVPAVCSAVGELPSFLSQGVDGFTCADHRDWVDTLEHLGADAGLRARIGDAGRARIGEEFSIEHCFSVLEGRFLAAESSKVG